jgi:PTS system nitrogen regulatory IIA component
LSRVEHGLDAVPTAERLEALSAELGLPATMLLEVGHRTSPLVQRYVEQAPRAAALFVAIARRNLDPDDLAEIERFVARRFPHAADDPRPDSVVHLTAQLEPDRVVLGLRCTDLDDACEVGAMRLSTVPRMPPVGELTAMLRRRAEEVEPNLGGGLAVIASTVAHARPTAALCVLARGLPATGLDATPIRALVLLIGPARGRDVLLRVAHLARLAARGLVTELASVRDPDDALRRIASLELVD